MKARRPNQTLKIYPPANAAEVARAVKLDHYCPLTEVPDLEPDDLEQFGPKAERILPHIYVSNKGIMVRFWYKGGLFEKLFKDRKSILTYFKLPEDTP